MFEWIKQFFRKKTKVEKVQAKGSKNQKATVPVQQKTPEKANQPSPENQKGEDEHNQIVIGKKGQKYRKLNRQKVLINARGGIVSDGGLEVPIQKKRLHKSFKVSTAPQDIAEVHNENDEGIHKEKEEKIRKEKIRKEKIKRDKADLGDSPVEGLTVRTISITPRPTPKMQFAVQHSPEMLLEFQTKNQRNQTETPKLHTPIPIGRTTELPGQLNSDSDSTQGDSLMGIGILDLLKEKRSHSVSPNFRPEISSVIPSQTSVVLSQASTEVGSPVTFHSDRSDVQHQKSSEGNTESPTSSGQSKP